ncbi:hypothetical protein ASG22_01030 [Chryseobacterium sp. Leaf405]|uniref:response regulator transcription factor n=1 Tax=Chryseobacterium sp. Leaf405 TaxID=1736367 RepID=UPI0006F35C79|nr:response regulator [Chryseobacterium sp. Leaf405]KQT35638.1 hypothetical protein ASG22_01030 [Chryseobacterium sp. Leaf405]
MDKNGGTKLFIVEDNEDIRYILKCYLEDEGFNISVFENVKTFRAMLHSNLPNIILLDVMLPDGNGLDLCNELKADSQLSNIPIIIMSAHLQLDKSHPIAANGFVKKPFDLEELSLTIKNHL